VASFADAVRGKTVAIVGPAPALTDQSAEVEAHDLVYWVSYRKNLQPHPKGYGDRVDAVYYTTAHARECQLGKYDSFIHDVPYVFYKKHKRISGHNAYPMIAKPFSNANQIQTVLHQLLKLKPAAIRVYGADLYLGGPDNSYGDGYDARPTAAQYWSIMLHDPGRQHRWSRATWRANQETILGDERFLRPLRMSNRKYLETLGRAWIDGTR
jgi:hypothetical protein